MAPGHSVEEVIGKTDFDVFSEEHAAAAFQDEQEIIRTGEPMAGKLERETFQDRADAWVSTTKMPLRDEHGQIIGTFGISRDVTAQIKAEKALAYQALHDPVTGLANRVALMDRLSQALAALERPAGSAGGSLRRLGPLQRRSTTRSVTMPATGCSPKSGAGSRSCLAMPIPSPASAGTSSYCCAGPCAMMTTSVSSPTASSGGSASRMWRTGATSPSPAASGSSSPAIPSPSPSS